MSEHLYEHFDSKVKTTRQFLSFVLAKEEYAVDILKVQEIRDWIAPTLVPNSPSYIDGVLNLRGEIIPVINLRDRLGLATTVALKNRIVIVLRIFDGVKYRLMGLLVDAFRETYDIDVSEITIAPPGASIIDDEFIIGLTTIEKKMIVLLDADILLNSNELAAPNNEVVA